MNVFYPQMRSTPVMRLTTASHLSRLTRLFVITTTLLMWSLTSLAQAQLERANQSIDISVSAGFQQRVQLDKWTPITITARNNGAAVTGHLEIIAADSRDRIHYQTRYRQVLELAKGAQKRQQFTIFISRIAQPLRIRVITAAGEVASKNIDLRSLLSQQRFIVALAKDANLDYLNDRKSRRTQVVYPLPGFLPTQWQGYDGVEAVIIHRSALDNLTPRQYSALTKWITSGGTLLLSGGFDTAILRTPRIARLLPARVTGTQQLDTQSDLRSALITSTDPASDDVDQPLTLSGPIGIASVDDTGSHTVHHVNNVPLVLKHRYGHGSVVLLTFDLTSHPFQTWPGMRPFMYRMLGLSVVKPITLNAQHSGSRALSLPNRLTRQRATDYPKHTTVIVFATLYLVVLALCARQLDAMPHFRRWRTLLLLAVPFTFTLGAVGLFHRILFPQSPALASVAVIEPIDNSVMARLQLELSAYSTRAHPLGIRYTGATPVLQTTSDPLLGNRPIDADQEMTLATWIFEQGNTTAAQPLEAIPYAVFSAEGKDIIDFEVSGSYQAGALLEFHNSSGRAITDLWAITRDKVFELGAVADDQTITATLSAGTTPDTGMPRDRHQWRDKLQDTHDGSSVAVEAVKAILSGEYGNRLSEDSATSVLLVGFTTNPWTMDNAKWNHIDLSMMVWRIHQHGSQP